MTDDNTLSTETSGDSFTAAEAAYFSSRGETTEGLAETPQDGAGSPPANDQTTTPAEGKVPASDAPAQSGEPSEDDGEEVIIVGKDGKPRAQGSGRFVPHAALHKERERRKGVETELLTTREKMARADERLAVLNDILAKSDAPAPASKPDDKPIDPAVDPIGALTQYQAKIAALEKQIAERDKQMEERESARSFRQAFERDAMAFMKEQPDFLNAYKHVLERRHQELEAMGFDDKATRDRMIADDERAIVTQAVQAKRSPSQIIYKLAQARGYVAPAKDAPKAPAVDPMAKIDALAKSQATAGASLSGAGGSSGEGLTPESLANMSDDEFAALQSRLGKAKMRQLMGG